MNTVKKHFIECSTYDQGVWKKHIVNECSWCCYRTDSEIYEDAVELQQFFIKIRDELCKNGEILLSPALSYTTKHLHNDVEKEKKEKLPKEIEEDKLKREEEKRV